MANQGGGREATDPTGSVLPFDPVLGAKHFGEIQEEGLRAAGALVERLVLLVDGPRVGPDADPDPARSEGTAGPADPGAVLPWFELWSDLVGRTAETMQRFRGVDRGPAGDGVQVGIDGGLAPAQPLRITFGATGRGDGEMWLHNGTTTDAGELIPRCGPFADVDGDLLDVDIEIDPPKIAGLPARSSRGFVISLTIDPTTPAGTYRGTVQVRGAEAVWMPIEAVVTASRW